MALNMIIVAVLASLASSMDTDTACEAIDSANLLHTKSKAANLLQTRSKPASHAVPEVFMGPGDDYCTDGVISESGSSGIDECGQRCVAVESCQFFSIWLTGWCRLSTSCLAIEQQPYSISIYKVPRPELYIAEGPDFCADTLSESGSGGKSDCASKCAADANCKFYSIWLNGGQYWCRLSSVCTTMWQQSWSKIEIWRMPQKTATTAPPTTPPVPQKGVKAAKEGVRQYGRNWYLSDPGQNCINTCFKYGLGYRMGKCSDSLMPELLGFTPSATGNMWKAHDVYNFKTDMWRRYKSCAANDYRDSDGTFSDPDHQLACPCGKTKECVWKQPDACEATFFYSGIRWSGCTGFGRSGDPWCQHSEYDTTYWSHCIKTCYDGSTGQVTQGQALVDTSTMKVRVPKQNHTVATGRKDTPPIDFPSSCSWVAPAGCVPEFSLGSANFTGCARMLDNGQSHTPWCSKTEAFEGSWAHCVFTCAEELPYEQAKAVDALNAKAAADSEICWLALASGCVPKSKVNGIEYTGCITPEEAEEQAEHDEVHGAEPWCSYDYVYAGNGAECELKCAPAS